jgi:hypothetical protein
MKSELEITKYFQLKGSPVSCEPYGNGHINNTYFVATNAGFEYILQQINKYVFKDPVSLMRNISAVTLSSQKFTYRTRNRFIN